MSDQAPDMEQITTPEQPQLVESIEGAQIATPDVAKVIDQPPAPIYNLYEDLALFVGYAETYARLTDEQKKDPASLARDYHQPVLQSALDLVPHIAGWMEEIENRVVELEEDFDDATAGLDGALSDVLPDGQGLVLRLNEFEAIFGFLSALAQDANTPEPIKEMAHGLCLMLGAKASGKEPVDFAKELDQQQKQE